jgi:hypothetical protein
MVLGGSLSRAQHQMVFWKFASPIKEPPPRNSMPQGRLIASRNNVLYRNFDISACGPRKSAIALSQDTLVPADRPIKEDGVSLNQSYNLYLEYGGGGAMG